MKALPPPNSVLPRLEPYGEAVTSAYEAFHRAPAKAAFDTLVDAILRSLAELPDDATITSEASLQEDLGLDSIGLAEAAFLVEDLFGRRLDNAHLLSITTVADLRTCLESEVWGPTFAE